MSEQTVAAPPRPGTRAPGKKYAGLTRNQWFIVGGVFVAALGYILWKRHQAAAAASSTAPTNQGSNECTDANGNPVDCNEAFAQELAALQNQLDQNGAASGAGGSTGGGGWGSSTGTGTGTGTTTGTSDGSGLTTGGGIPGWTQPVGAPGTVPGTVAAPPKTAGAITGLAASSVTKTSFRASWKAAANATGYQYQVRNLATHTDQTSLVQTKSTSVTISGLKSGTDYNFGVQALPGGPGANIHVRTT